MTKTSLRKKTIRDLERRINLQQRWNYMQYRIKGELPTTFQVFMQRKLRDRLQLVQDSRYLAREPYRNRRKQALDEFREDLNEEDGCWLKSGEFKVIKWDGSLEDHKYDDDRLMQTPVKSINK